MATTRELITTTFSRLGLDAKTIDGLFPAEGTEAALDVEAVLQRAQEYSKPFLKEHFEKELQSHFKGRYVNETLGKIVKASGGLITRDDVENKTIEEAVAMFQEKIASTAGKTDKEKDDMISALNKKLETAETEWQAKVDGVNAEWQGKEEKRQVSSTLLKKLQGMSDKIIVDPVTAAETLLPLLDFKYSLKVENDDLHPYDKADPTKRVKKSDTAFATIDEDITSLIDRFKWGKQSNGGAGGTGGNDGAGGGKQPHIPATGAAGAGEKKESPLTTAAREKGLLPAA